MGSKKESHECECGKPEIRKSFKEGCCSDEQIVKCHGQEYLNRSKPKESE
ncbi:MAG: hypothetical protein R6U96_10225 [Promethearchaeia archaeon]